MTNSVLIVPIFTAALLGLRHALDPDHLVAVAGLSADDARPRHVVRLGLAWGVGHAVVLAGAGMAIVALGWGPSAGHQQMLERIVGLAIALVGLRLVVGLARPNLRRDVAVRSVTGWRTGLAMGGLQGLAGTGGVTLLLLPVVPAAAVVPALVVFAAMTCVSMLICCLITARLLALHAPGERTRRYGGLVIGLASVAFGLVYVTLA